METKANDAIKTAHQQADKLRQELRTLVLQSRPGTPLPSEHALAYKYKVSRLTARRILKKLEAEDLVECRNKVGCFVKGKKTVTLLLPCPEFWDEKFYPDNQFYFRYFQGALQAATARGMHLETIAVSPTNDRNHIQYSLLDEIHAGSLVICSVWFNRLYDFFATRGAHVAILETRHEDYGYQHFHKEFYTMNGDRLDALTKMLEYFYAKGKRRIALDSTVYTKPNRCFPDTYAEWCRARSLPVLRYSFPGWKEQGNVTPHGYIAELYRQDKFDALIFHHASIANAHGTIQETLGIPPEIPVFGLEFGCEFTPGLSPFPCAVVPCEAMVQTAVTVLDETPPRGSEWIFPYHFVNVPDDWEAIIQNFNNNQ